MSLNPFNLVKPIVILKGKGVFMFKYNGFVSKYKEIKRTRLIWEKYL